MSKRDNHYATSEEKFVKTTILYGEIDAINDGMSIIPVYYDANYENPVYAEDLEDLYLDGVLVKCHNNVEGVTVYYTPTMFSPDGMVMGCYENADYTLLFHGLTNSTDPV